MCTNVTIDVDKIFRAKIDTYNLVYQGSYIFKLNVRHSPKNITIFFSSLFMLLICCVVKILLPPVGPPLVLPVQSLIPPPALTAEIFEPPILASRAG